MNYYDALKSESAAALDQLHQDVSELRFTDFPDYENIGDSAIALGQWKYWDLRGIHVRSVTSAHTLDPKFYDSDVPVVINGGGNLGGLYRAMSEHRYLLAENLKPSTPLIQAPQSVYFPDAVSRVEFVDRFIERKNLRIGVRDAVSARLVREAGRSAVLGPDSVHMLGKIDAPRATRNLLVLARRDDESKMSFEGACEDWPRDPIRRRVHTAIGWRTKQVPALRRLLVHPPVVWRNWASARLLRGVMVIADAETIVTDRLHAMLIALQMGRRVIAVDNNNGKLTSYAEAWLNRRDIPLEFAESLADAFRRGTRS